MALRPPRHLRLRCHLRTAFRLGRVGGLTAAATDCAQVAVLIVGFPQEDPSSVGSRRTIGLPACSAPLTAFCRRFEANPLLLRGQFRWYPLRQVASAHGASTTPPFKTPASLLHPLHRYRRLGCPRCCHRFFFCVCVCEPIRCAFFIRQSHNQNLRPTFLETSWSC